MQNPMTLVITAEDPSLGVESTPPHHSPRPSFMAVAADVCEQLYHPRVLRGYIEGPFDGSPSQGPNRIRRQDRKGGPHRLQRRYHLPEDQ